MRRCLGMLTILSASLAAGGCGSTRGSGGDADEPLPALPAKPPSGAKAGPAGAYRWASPCPPGTGGSHGILVTEVYESGGRFLRARGLPGEGRGMVAMTMGAGGITSYFDAPGSTDVHVGIDPAVGSTTYAGLRFTKACAVEILQDGTVLVDVEGMTVTDTAGRSWQSRSADARGVRVHPQLSHAAGRPCGIFV